ncbi:MAG: hypothetical protein ACYCW6_07745 [Candidatus Xenobia bacterium]
MIRSIGGAAAPAAAPRSFDGMGGAAVVTDDYVGGTPENLGVYAPRKAQLPADDKMKALAQAAADGLAQKLGVKPEAVQVTDFEVVTWNNSSLGFSQRDMGYADDMEPGYRVALQNGNDRYEYHAAFNRNGRYAQMPPAGHMSPYFHPDARGILVPDPYTPPQVW